MCFSFVFLSLCAFVSISNKKSGTNRFVPLPYINNVYSLLLLLEVWQHVLALVAENFLHLVNLEE